MPIDEQMRIVRQQINLVIEECAIVASTGGPDAVRALKVVESAEVPARPLPSTISTTANDSEVKA